MGIAFAETKPRISQIVTKKKFSQFLKSSKDCCI